MHSWPRALRYHEEAKEHVEARLRDGELAGDLERIKKSVSEGQLTRAGLEDALRVTVASLGREGDKNAAAVLIRDICDGGPDHMRLIAASGAIAPPPPHSVAKGGQQLRQVQCFLRHCDPLRELIYIIQYIQVRSRLSWRC